MSLASSALLLCGQHVFADCLGPAASPAPEETLGSDYQPSKYDSNDHTVLHWRRYSPDTEIWGDGPYPTVIVVHAGEFKEYDDLGSLGQRYAHYDLQQAGYLVFSVEHRLAPPGLIEGQTGHCTPGGDYDCAPGTVESGRPPEQSNDIKQEIAAAYHDMHCHGEIFLLGASSGGTHVAWCALDPTPLPSPAPGWPLPTGAIKAVAGLSGVYDLSYRGDDVTSTFINDVVNYTNTTDTDAQLLVSPIHLVADATDIPPFLLFTSEHDPVPFEVTTTMKNTLNGRVAGIAVSHIISGNDHAFLYWHENDPDTNLCVSADVIEFFDDHK